MWLKSTAFIYLVNPELFTTELGCIRVATEGLAQGQTMMNRKALASYPQAGWEQDKPLTQVCMTVNAPACLTLIEETLMAPWLT
jgi:inosine-uridine nucleoside N-ribohydrolase